MRIISLLSIAFLSVAFIDCARADEIASAPGWQLTKINSEKGEGDYSYDARVFYTLKPPYPDPRPAITIDSRAADRLRSGEAVAEVIFSGGSGGKNPIGTGDEHLYDNRNNGIVMAEPVKSTLTLADGGNSQEAAGSDISGSSGSSQPSEARRPSSRDSGSSLNTSFPSSSRPKRRLGFGNYVTRPRDSSAASAPPTAANGEVPPTGGGDRAIVDPRIIAQAQSQVSVDAGVPPSQGSINAVNEPGGFGIPKRDKDGKVIDKKEFEVVFPDGEPGNPDTKPKCEKTASLTFDKEIVKRVTVPTGCRHIKVRVWGAGGGEGVLFEIEKVTKLPGAAANFVYTEGDIDEVNNDIVVVVGAPGANTGTTKGAPGGFPEGKSGVDGGNGGGGGGGGYSGVFLAEKGKSTEPFVSVKYAIAGASGGDGGGIKEIQVIGGAGGHLVPGEDVPEGRDFYRFLDKFKVESSFEKSKGAKPGGESESGRGKAGESGQPGKVIIDFT